MSDPKPLTYPRAQVVELLFDAMVDAMHTVTDEVEATPSEIVSATLTVATKAARVVINRVDAENRERQRMLILEAFQNAIYELDGKTGTVH
jgi:hypothetical protein